MWLDRLGSTSLVRVGVLSLLWLGLLAWARPLMLLDEGRYVGVAWEMLRSGHWLVPTLDGLPYFQKPPLFYWITVVSMKWFGVNEWAARLASLLGACAGALSVFWLVRRWWGARSAGLALAVLLMQPMFYLGAQFANLDMLVAGCITVTIVALAHAAMAMERAESYRIVLLGAYVAAAMGVLAKGLIGFVLPALVIGVWLLLERRWRVLFRLLWLPGALVFLALTTPWFLAMQARYPDFLNYFFVVQHFRRFAAGGFNNVQPFWFYPVILTLATLPWLPWLAPQFSKVRLLDQKRGPLRRLLCLWVILIVGFFSLPASKLLGYVLPVLPPLAVLLADGFESMHSSNTWRMRGIWLAGGGSMVISFLVIAALSRHTSHSSKAIAAVLHVQRKAGEPVYMVENYDFDLPVYARLEAPTKVVLNWQDASIHRHDTWRKEMVDAASFAPQMSAAILLQPSQLGVDMCSHRVVWVVVPMDMTKDFPFLSMGRWIGGDNEKNLWRLDAGVLSVRRALGCPGIPTTG